MAGRRSSKTSVTSKPSTGSRTSEPDTESNLTRRPSISLKTVTMSQKRSLSTFSFSKKVQQEDYHEVESCSDGMKLIYDAKLKPLEIEYRFDDHFPLQYAAEFTAKPLILVVGQYSTGKTTFISHILGEEYPGSRVGTEPTTDKFIAICKGDNMVIPGNVAVSDISLPWRSLEKFGNSFLQRFQVSMSTNTILDRVTIVDTPGVLSGEQQRENRGYDFDEVVKSFAEKADVIILIFDASKLDISDEYKRCIVSLLGYEEKIKVVFNKADSVATDEMVRVYGALMWSLGRVFNCPEMPRMYVSSFWDKFRTDHQNAAYFKKEQEALYTDLSALPKASVIRKLNDMLKRARAVLAYATVMAHVKKTIPIVGKRKAKENITKDMGKLCEDIKREHRVDISAHISPTVLVNAISATDFSKITKYNQHLFDNAKTAIETDIPSLLEQLPNEGGEFDDIGDNLFRGNFSSFLSELTEENLSTDGREADETESASCRGQGPEADETESASCSGHGDEKSEVNSTSAKSSADT